ncbi:excisionase family DNA-binding protein [Mycobacterium marinum]|uniref:excisionase family DNA-binding protein n=1 Tax=Mycobacterium marinum TaxID=1781 RepID=UPI000E3C9D31|nr:excisionase family DNA-binding protein [Mycobacterium marinum]
MGRPGLDPSPPPRRWASLKQAGVYLGVTDRTVREHVSCGLYPAYRLNGRLVRVDLNEVDAAMVPFGGDV